ncbi:MAG TPA: DUF4386 domain-containing protein [Gemmatimonadaceae bacterium]|nr:DUF4386 domain-containing protein [Gemmatimonadaceae bacterium]
METTCGVDIGRAGGGMTRNTNARIAGVAYLLYIGVAFPSMVMFSKVTAGADVSAKLASVARHANDLRLMLVLDLVGVFCALTLAVTLYGITREEDNELAMFGLVCRAGEGILAAILIGTNGLLWLATINGPAAPDIPTANTIGTLLLKIGGWQTASAATLFAVGSTAFCYLLLRGRMIPAWLAWVGMVGSAIVAVGVPLERISVVTGSPAQLMWIPIAVFEITVAVWFIIKGVAPARRRVMA